MDQRKASILRQCLEPLNLRPTTPIACMWAYLVADSLICVRGDNMLIVQLIYCYRTSSALCEMSPYQQLDPRPHLPVEGGKDQ